MPQKNNRLKIVLTILFSLFVIGLAIFIGFLVKYKFFNKNGTTNNLPGRLLGPISSNRAPNLDADKIIYWTNKYRADEKLSPLTKNIILTNAATIKADDMFTQQYFEHVSPTGVAPADLVKTTGYYYKTTGENLALGDFKDEKDLVDAWMNSPGHRANILNPDYTEIGVASKLDNFEDRRPTWISVQEFGRPLPNCDAPDPNTLNDINNKKAQYDTLTAEINSLNSEASSLNDQANQKIQQGNDIYAATGDISLAQPYWNEGDALRALAQAKSNEANLKIDQANVLLAEIKAESDAYNTQAGIYNECIKG